MQRECRLRIFESGSKREEFRGQTVNMSSGGLLLQGEWDLELGTLLEVAVRWPVQINEQCSLKLVALARVIRVQEREAALTIERYEFRTLGLSGFRQ